MFSGDCWCKIATRLEGGVVGDRGPGTTEMPPGRFCASPRPGPPAIAVSDPIRSSPIAHASVGTRATTLPASGTPYTNCCQLTVALDDNAETYIHSPSSALTYLTVRAVLSWDPTSPRGFLAGVHGSSRALRVREARSCSQHSPGLTVKLSRSDSQKDGCIRLSVHP
ncbi:hypothetical protein OH77DRAFT_1249503 [Trametes cingulata]|nr:hypothetical protein OH77DRAFT_1249503 [Trametes cingulata]